MSRNVLNKLPKSVHPWAKSLIHEIYMAHTEKEARKAFHQFKDNYEAKYPKAWGGTTFIDGEMKKAA